MKKYRSIIFLAALLVVLSPAVFLVARPFLGPLAVAAVIAIAVYPIHGQVRRVLRRPGPAALVSTLAALLVTVIAVSVVGVMLAQEASDAYRELSQMSAERGGWVPFLSHMIDWPLDQISRRFPVDTAGLRADLFNKLKDFAGTAAARIGAGVQAISTSFVHALIVFIALYFFLRYGEDWAETVRERLPVNREQSGHLLRAITDTITANVNGVLAVAIGQGVLIFLGFWILGLHSPVTWGFLAALFSMVPIVGTAVVWIPWVLVLLVQAEYWKALVLVIWGTLPVGMFDNIVRPLVVSGRVKQHPLLVGLSMLGGASAFGMIGLLLGPVVFSLAAAVIRTLGEEVEQASRPAEPAA